MDIKQLAHDIIIALNLVPKEKVRIDVVSPDWSNEPEIRVTSEPSKPEDETQFGPVSETTVLGIHVLAGTRKKAEALKTQAAEAVYARFEELEQQRGSGIFCIVYDERGSVQLPNSPVFHSYSLFRVLHQY